MISITRSIFGGHVVEIVEGARIYTLVVTGARAFGTCEYRYQAKRRSYSGVVVVRRELQDGPTLSRLTTEALRAIGGSAQ